MLPSYCWATYAMAVHNVANINSESNVLHLCNKGVDVFIAAL